MKNEFDFNDPLDKDLVANILEESELAFDRCSLPNISEEKEEESEEKEEVVEEEEEEVDIDALSEEELDDIVMSLVEEGELHECPLCKNIMEEEIPEEDFMELAEEVIDAFTEAEELVEDDEDEEE